MKRNKPLHPDSPLLHACHSKPVSRRDFIACGLSYGAAVLTTGSVFGMFIGGLGMWCMLRVLEVLSRGDLGGGDVGLGGLLGLYLGWLSYEAILVGLFASFLVGGLFAVALLVTRKANRNTHFAFGPFLIVGTLIAVLR